MKMKRNWKKKKKALTQSELNEKFMIKPRHSHKIHIEKEINKFKVELMLKLRKKINVKKIKNKDWCQLKLTSYTCDPGHETRMTASKKITKLNLQPSNVEGLKSKKKINLKKIN